MLKKIAWKNETESHHHYPLDSQPKRFSDTQIGNSPADRIWLRVQQLETVGIPNEMDRTEPYGANRAEENGMYKMRSHGAANRCETASGATCTRSVSTGKDQTIFERSHNSAMESNEWISGLIRDWDAGNNCSINYITVVPTKCILNSQMKDKTNEWYPDRWHQPPWRLRQHFQCTIVE